MKLSINIDFSKDKKEPKIKKPQKTKESNPNTAFKRKQRFLIVLFRILAVLCSIIAFIIYPIITAIFIANGVLLGAIPVMLLFGLSLFLCCKIWRYFSDKVFEIKLRLPPIIENDTHIFRQGKNIYGVDEVAYAFFIKYLGMPPHKKQKAFITAADIHATSLDLFNDFALAVLLFLKNYRQRITTICHDEFFMEKLSKDEFLIAFHDYHRELEDKSPIAFYYCNNDSTNAQE